MRLDHKKHRVRKFSRADESLSQLCRHYDVLSWSVTAIWLAAVWVLITNCLDEKKFDIYFAVAGQGMPVAAMLFFLSFRLLRRRIIARIRSPLFRLLHRTSGTIPQWEILTAIVLAMVWAWWWVTWKVSPNNVTGMFLWTLVPTFVAGWIYLIERPNPSFCKRVYWRNSRNERARRKFQKTQDKREWDKYLLVRKQEYMRDDQNSGAT